MDHTMRTTWVSGLAAVLLVWCSLILPPAALANEDETMSREGGWGAGAAVCTVLYSPVKVIYATGGLLVGGLAYVFSAGDRAVVDPILTASVRGDYVVTPSHLRGKRPLEFIGRFPQDRNYPGPLQEAY